jgi:hypothetical protein
MVQMGVAVVLFVQVDQHLSNFGVSGGAGNQERSKVSLSSHAKSTRRNRQEDEYNDTR